MPHTEEKSEATGGANLLSLPNDNNSDIEIKEGDIEILNVSGKCEDDKLHRDDFDKYTGNTKFNPKSFKAGQGHGTISP